MAAAIRERDLGRVRGLLDEMPDLLRARDRRSNEPIHWAVMTRQIEVIDELVFRGADPNARRGDGALPIHLTNGDASAVTRLLEEDPGRAHDPEALSMAAERGNENVVRLLLRHAPDLPRQVTVSRPIEIAELLFEHGMDANRPDWLRATPLYHFAGDGDTESAALFLDHGADLAARDEEHASTPLAWAARKGRTRMVEFLLRRGARLELPDDPPWATPLAWATRRGHDEIVRILGDSRRSGALADSRGRRP